MSDNNIQSTVCDARESWHFGNENPMLLLCGLTCEVGELASVIRAKYVYNKELPPDEDKSSLKHEMADVAIYLYALAEKCGIDLDSAIKSKIEINNKRFKK
ncbi:MAG: hypothetical protein K2M23_00770 [Alphaproteobacteria bacterium]|nr:hypothetical protein [Alphaproteobacteria bacterium]